MGFGGVGSVSLLASSLYFLVPDPTTILRVGFGVTGLEGQEAEHVVDVDLQTPVEKGEGP